MKLQFFCRSVVGTFNAYQLLTSEGPHVWKVWTDDDDDALKALYRASPMCTYFHSKPMHSWPELCAPQYHPSIPHGMRTTLQPLQPSTTHTLSLHARITLRLCPCQRSIAGPWLEAIGPVPPKLGNTLPPFLPLTRALCDPPRQWGPMGSRGFPKLIKRWRG